MIMLSLDLRRCHHRDLVHRRRRVRRWHQWRRRSEGCHRETVSSTSPGRRVRRQKAAAALVVLLVWRIARVVDGTPAQNHYFRLSCVFIAPRSLDTGVRGQLVLVTPSM